MTTNHTVNTMKNILKALQVLLLVTVSVASQAAVESTTYILTDHLGSPILATDENGDTLWQEDYLPYGKQITNEDGDNSVGFTGHKDDKALGVTYMQGRWYHQDMGRFLAIDPVGFVEGNPASFNRYAYANSNPYKFIDPDGNVPLDYLIDGVSVAASAAIYANDPSLWNGISLGTDILLAGLPYVPAGIGILRGGDKMLDTTKAVDAASDVTRLVDPKTIRFTQDSIKATFKDGRSLRGLIDDLKSGKVTADDLPAIRTFERDGKLYSLDNRRLKAFQEADVPVRTRSATAEEMKNEAFKLTSKNDGASIRVRGDGL